jgi:hypothetical protein
MHIVRSTSTEPRQWEFWLPDGRRHPDWLDARGLAHVLIRESAQNESSPMAVTHGGGGSDSGSRGPAVSGAAPSTTVLADPDQSANSGSLREPSVAETGPEELIRVDGFDHPEARRIRPGWCGKPFDLHECVQALFRMQLTDHTVHDGTWVTA